MKNILKNISVIFIVGFLLFYFAFLIAIPTIDLNNYKTAIQKTVKENSKLNIEYSSLKIYTTPMLSIGITAKDLNVFYDDNTSIFKSKRFKGGVALPSLLTLTLKTSKIYLDTPEINLEIIDSKQYKIVQLVEKILNEQIKKQNNQQNTIQTETQDTTVLENNEFLENVLKLARIKVPSIKIKNYLVKVDDTKSKHGLNLSGEELVLKYSSAKNHAVIKTHAQLKSDNNKNIDAKINLTLPTPKISLVNNTPKEQNDPEEEISIPFINIVEIYQTYDLKTNIDSKLKLVKLKNGNMIGFGHFDIDNLTLKLSHITLPESYLHSKFHSGNIDFDTNIYCAKDEKFVLSGNLTHGKKNKLEADIKSDDIQFEHLANLLKGLLDSLNVKNDIDLIKTTGYLNANAKIKTDFKTLKSNGLIKVADGSFVHSKIGLGIKDIKAELNFDDNALNIKNTQATINDSLFKIAGFIDSKSNVDINLKTDNLNLPVLYQAFAPKEIKKAYLLTNALLNINADIKGKLKDLNSKISVDINNLALSDYRKTMFITNNKAAFTLKSNKDETKADLENSGFNFTIPKNNFKTSISKILLDIDENLISIKPFDLIYNSSSKITTKGEIKNYAKNPDINLFLDGFIATNNIKQSLGKDISSFLSSCGNIPLKISIKGNKKEQNITAQIHNDKNNFITPINLATLQNAQSVIQADVKIKDNKIKLNNTGLYKTNTNFTDNLAQNMQNAKQLIELSAIIEGNHLNLLRLNIPQELSGNIAMFKKSTFKTKGKVVANGLFNDLSYKGNLKAYDVKIPELLTEAKNIDLNLSNKTLKLDAKEINLNSSIINSNLNIDLRSSKVFKISNLNVNSQSIDVDKTMKILDNLNKYIPQNTQTNANKTKTAQNSSIPLFAEGKFDIKKIKSGQIILDNTKGNLLIKNNNLIVDKFATDAFAGILNGKISVNLINGLINAKLNGSKINADTLLVQCANMKDTISGILKFNTDISLKGATYEEQMKSLKGNLDFEISDGQYGPFAKLENFFLAENIRENPFFSSTIGVILNPITTIDSTHFEQLKGKLNFNNGIAQIPSITSRGDILCILIKGQMDLIQNTLDSTVRVRLASAVNDLLGPLAMANPVNIVKKSSNLTLANAGLFNLFTQTVKEEEYKQIPDFSANHTDENATKFQIILQGDVAKPLKLVKSFKWLALEDEMEQAKLASDNYIKEQQELAKQAVAKKIEESDKLNEKVKTGLGKILNTEKPVTKETILKDAFSNLKEKTQGKIKLYNVGNKTKTNENPTNPTQNTNNTDSASNDNSNEAVSTQTTSETQE